MESISLRDFIATQAMAANMSTWNSEISDEYRIKLLQDWVKRFGNENVYKCIALISYEMADAMLSVKDNNQKFNTINHTP